MQSNGSTFCFPCPAGKRGSAQRKKCYSCPKGFHQPNTGETSCDFCDEGTYQEQTSQTYCSACSAGQYNNKKGQPSCLDCKKHTKSSNAKSETCTDCKKGQVAEQTGSTSCTNCQSGLYGDRVGHCENCPVGKIRADFHPTTECIECHDGKRPNDRQTSCESPSCKKKNTEIPLFCFLLHFIVLTLLLGFSSLGFFAKSFLKYKGGRARPANNTCMIFQRKTHRSGSVKIAPSAATAVGVALGNKSRDNEVI